jgi:DNA-directed RNA polymerase subunit F
LGRQGLVAGGHIRDLNNIRLQGLRNEITGTTGELNRFRNLSNKFVAAFKPIEEGGGGGGGGGGATGPTAFERVQKFIKDSQKDLAKAQETYNKTIAAAQKRYAEQVLKTEQEFANKLADIIQQSQDRLRTAFESVVRVSLADIFEVEETKSVANLIAGLTNRLSKSQALLEKAGKLNAAGFSQTFIEQVVQAGVDTGNELASAILESTPQTQAELQRLFTSLEATAETGMDSLAREIYEKQGLATRELKNLYVQTQTELTEALKQLQLDFNQEVIDANLTLIESVKKIREAFTENIESMKGDLGGLDKVVSDFLKKLGQVETKAEERIDNITSPVTGGGPAGTTGGMTGIVMAASSVTDATGIFIDAMSDVSRVIDYLNERINAANKFANEAAIAGRTAEAMSAVNLRNEFRSQLGLIQTLGTGAVGTTININVKTDSTQSLAMVGKTLGNTITKYVSAGGQVLVSPTN